MAVGPGEIAGELGRRGDQRVFTQKMKARD